MMKHKLKGLHVSFVLGTLTFHVEERLEKMLRGEGMACINRLLGHYLLVASRQWDP